MSSRELAIMAIKARVERGAREALRGLEIMPDIREEAVGAVAQSLAAAAAALMVFDDLETLADGSLRFAVTIPAAVLRHLRLCTCDPNRPDPALHLPNCPESPAALAHWGDPCRFCGVPHDAVKPGPCPGRVGRSCICDEAGEGPCPVHGPAMAEQDERIRRENEQRLREMPPKPGNEDGHFTDYPA